MLQAKPRPSGSQAESQPCAKATETAQSVAHGLGKLDARRLVDGLCCNCLMEMAKCCLDLPLPRLSSPSGTSGGGLGDPGRRRLDGCPPITGPGACGETRRTFLAPGLDSTSQPSQRPAGEAEDNLTRIPLLDALPVRPESALLVYGHGIPEAIRGRCEYHLDWLCGP